MCACISMCMCTCVLCARVPTCMCVCVPCACVLCTYMCVTMYTCVPICVCVQCAHVCTCAVCRVWIHPEWRQEQLGTSRCASHGVMETVVSLGQDFSLSPCCSRVPCPSPVAWPPLPVSCLVLLQVHSLPLLSSPSDRNFVMKMKIGKMGGVWCHPSSGGQIQAQDRWCQRTVRSVVPRKGTLGSRGS